MLDPPLQEDRQSLYHSGDEEMLDQAARYCGLDRAAEGPSTLVVGMDPPPHAVGSASISLSVPGINQ